MSDRARVLRQAGEVLHGHLVAAPTRKRSTDAELAAKLDGLGIWPVLPREALAAGLAPVLADARRLWECRPPDPVRCADCGHPRDEDVCELHRRVRYAWLDVLDRLAARIVDEVPARARAQMRSGS